MESITQVVVPGNGKASFYFDSVYSLVTLHTGPLVPAVKVKRHEIKSDPTPLGFEGMSISILHENLFSSFFISFTEFTSHRCQWMTLEPMQAIGVWCQFIC